MKNPCRNVFLAVCYIQKNKTNLNYLNEFAEFGGPIGPGNSNLKFSSKCFKVFRLHVISHDAFGFMKSNKNIGPGYVFILSKKPIFANSLFLGHITGIACWIVMKKRKNSDH